MEEFLADTFRYVAENGGYLGGTAVLGITAHGFYRSVLEDVPEAFRKEAEAYSHDELAEQINDLNATFKLSDHGAEFEGSKEDFYMFYDGFFRPRRSQRKEALTDEAEKRGIKFLQLGENDYIVGPGNQIEDLPPSTDLREVVPEEEFSSDNPTYHSTSWIEEQLESNETEPENTRDKEEVNSVIKSIEEDMET